MKRLHIKLLVHMGTIHDADTIERVYKGSRVDKHIVSVDLSLDDVAHFEQTIHDTGILKITGGIEYE
ncbi:MAG: hypothetical protein COB09_18635 [Thalassobium sp.]|nr:MAG: hypothetical protein COB09_18635 [Thalassobium sp.]